MATGAGPGAAELVQAVLQHVLGFRGAMGLVVGGCGLLFVSAGQPQLDGQSRAVIFGVMFGLGVLVAMAIERLWKWLSPLSFNALKTYRAERDLLEKDAKWRQSLPDIIDELTDREWYVLASTLKNRVPRFHRDERAGRAEAFFTLVEKRVFRKDGNAYRIPAEVWDDREALLKRFEDMFDVEF